MKFQIQEEYFFHHIPYNSLRTWKNQCSLVLENQIYDDSLKKEIITPLVEIGEKDHTKNKGFTLGNTVSQWSNSAWGTGLLNLEECPFHSYEIFSAH